MPKFIVTTGINYTPRGSKAEVRREPGDVVDDLTLNQVAAFTQMGAIEPQKAEAP